VVTLLGFSGYYLASFLDFWGLQYVSASLERLILYLNPTLVLLLGRVLFKRSVAPRQLLALAISYAGVLLVFGQELKLEGADTARRGPGLRQHAELCAVPGVQRRGGQAPGRAAPDRAGHQRGLRAVHRAVPAAAAVAGALQVAEPVLWLSLLNATLCTFAPVLMVMMAIERIGATLTAQTGMIGPLSTIAMGVLDPRRSLHCLDRWPARCWCWPGCGC
jgi:hypothetical protein